MHDHVLHLGIADRALRMAAPGFLGRGIVRVDPDDVDLVEVLELDTLRVGHPAAHHQVQKLLRHSLAFRAGPKTRFTCSLTETAGGRKPLASGASEALG